MTLELDHVFVWVEKGAPEAGLLVDAGFKEGEPNVHPGQGTANRRFFFNGLMLELIWVAEPHQVQDPGIAPARFLERWQGRRKNTSPFGLVFRSGGGRLPFDVLDFTPPYLPPGLKFAMGSNAGELAEPLIFVMPPGLDPGNPPSAGRDLEGYDRVTEVTVRLPGATAPQSPAAALGQVGRLVVKDQCPAHLMEIEFDGRALKTHMDFTPALPLVLYA